MVAEVTEVLELVELVVFFVVFVLVKLRGGIQKKKLVFFGVYPNERDPPPLPCFWMA